MTDTIKLTDAQSVILSLAAQHEDGITTDMIAEKVTVAKPKRAADSLAKRGLLEAADLPHESGVRTLPGYRITAKGKAALGIEDEAPAEDDLPRYDPDHARKGTVPIPAKEASEPPAEKPEAERKGTDEIVHEAGAEVGAENRRAEAGALAKRIADGEERATEKRLMAIAEAGVMPPPPDFSAEIHKPFRKHLEPMVAAAHAGDLAALKAWEPHRANSTDLRAIDRFRRAAIVAIENGAKATAA